MESVIKTKTTVNKVNERVINKANNSTKLAQSKLSKSLEKSINSLDELSKTLKNKTKLESKSINLLNEVKKATKKVAPTTKKVIEKSSFKTVVIGTNNIFKTNFNSLGYLLKIVSNEEQQIFEEQKKNSDFNEFDAIKLNSIFTVIKLARKNSELYKAIQDLKGIRTKKDNYCIFFLLRSINTNLHELNKLIELQNWK
jgi:hypothetical protein